jgi:molecular chaperone HtpG
MLLSDHLQDLVPDWAFFARCAIDAELLRPTANREALVEDDLLELVRESIGDQIRSWLVRLAATQPGRFQSFLELHHLGVKAMALADDEMLALVLPLLPFETNEGTSTLADLFRTTDVIRVAPTVEDFEQLAAVAAAQGVAVINGGYTYALELARRFPDVEPTAVVALITAGDIDSHITHVPEARLRDVSGQLAQVRAALEPARVDVELRAFAPASVPALFVDDQQARARRTSREVAEHADDAWSALLASFDDGGADRPQLLLNDANPTLRRILELADAHLRRLAVESLYCRALLAGHHAFRPADSALLDRSFNALLDLAVGASTPASSPLEEP